MKKEKKQDRNKQREKIEIVKWTISWDIYFSYCILKNKSALTSHDTDSRK